MGKLLDYKTCLMLEEKNFSYKEMIDYLGLKISKSYLSRTFASYNIIHKAKKERVKSEMSDDKGSIAYLARKYKCSKSTIYRIRKEKKMIKWHKEKQKDLVEYTIKGHANYDSHGKDIVCSAVSTVVIYTINIAISLGYIIDHFIEEGHIQFKMKNKTKNQKIVSQVLEATLMDLTTQYPNYIKNDK